MSNPSRVFTLAVPASGEFVQPDPLPFPANVVITMAAIDPTATALGDGPKLATLKILHRPVATEFDAEDYLGEGYSDSDEDDEDDDEEEESEDKDEEAKQLKSSRKKAAAAAILKLLDETTAMDVDEAKLTNGKKAKKAKKATEEDSESEEDDEEEESEDEDDFVEESVICTLDPTRLYQQPLNIVIADGEEILFKSNGAYTIYLSGNYTMPDDHDHDHSDDEDYDDEDDLSPGEDDYYLNGLGDSDEESDELDDLEDPRISEVVSDEEIVIAAPKLSKKEKKAAAKAAVETAKKVEKAVAPAEPATKKRAADEMEVDTPKPIANGAKPAAGTPETPALSKKQLKKLKANNGEAAAAPSPSSEKKKVQFASELEQGPTPNGTKSAATAVSASPSAKPAAAAAVKSAVSAAAAKPAAPTSRTVKGVELVDKKIGNGVEAKNGQKVSMRYIGKLLNGKTFDSNTKGKPFTFKLGAGEVIKGWDIGIAGMKVGGERKLTIPAGLAYGNSGTPGIPKNSVLTFEVKLLEIK